jgi:hypothetical protein
VVMTVEKGGIERLRGEPIIYSEGLYSIELNHGLSEWEVEDAWRVLRWIKGNGPFFGFSGTMLISGPRRQGKGTFGNVLSWKGKRYFKGKHVLRDDHPTALYGPYTFFNEDTFVADVAAAADVAEDDIPRESRKVADKAKMASMVNEWRSSERGQVMMQNSIILKDEFWKDMNKRRPMNPMNLLFGGVLKTVYHLEAMILGIVQRVEDLDRFTCLPDVNLHAKCRWAGNNTTRVTLWHVEWSASKQQLIPTEDRPIVIYLNGAVPQAQLGGHSWFEIFNSKAAPNLKSLMDRNTPGIKYKDLFNTGE